MTKFTRTLALTAILGTSLTAQTQVVSIREILQAPQAFTGKAVLLEGTIVRVVQGSGSYSFVELRDSELDTIRVRTDLRSLEVGRVFRVQGRVRADALSPAPYIMEEMMLYLGVDTGYFPPPAPASAPQPVPMRQADAEPAKADSDLSWLIRPRRTAEAPQGGSGINPPPSISATAPPTGRQASAPQYHVSPSESGMFAFCFRQAQGPLQEIMITQLGRLFAAIVHPTCQLVDNRLTFAGRDNDGTLKVRFATTYTSLLRGEEHAVWELIFNSEGNIADIRFLRDSSPFTDVGLLNQVKGRIIGYISDQIQALQF